MGKKKMDCHESYHLQLFDLLRYSFYIAYEGKVGPHNNQSIEKVG